MGLGGCIKSIFKGCASLITFFILAGVAISLLNNFISFFPAAQNLSIDETVKTDERTNDTFYESVFEWEQQAGIFSSSTYRLKFTLPKKEVDAAMAYLKKISRMSYDQIGADESVYYDDSLQFYCDYWKLVYGKIVRRDAPYIRKIRQGLNKITQQYAMTDQVKVAFLIGFVQNIDYKIPDTPLGVLPPVPVIKERFADCDSKALLLYLLLQGMDIGCIIYYSPYYQHAMLGVDYPGLRDKKYLGNIPYYFLETTYPGWEVGQLPPDMSNKDLWFILDLKN